MLLPKLYIMSFGPSLFTCTEGEIPYSHVKLWAYIINNSFIWYIVLFWNYRLSIVNKFCRFLSLLALVHRKLKKVYYRIYSDNHG